MHERVPGTNLRLAVATPRGGGVHVDAGDVRAGHCLKPGPHLCPISLASSMVICGSTVMCMST